MKLQVPWIDDNRQIVNNALRTYAEQARYVLEVGSGVSTEVISSEIEKRNGHIWTIDIGSGKTEKPEVITAIKDNSLKAPWTRCVDMLYLDGCHRPHHLLQELLRFSKFVNPGGYILCDDIRIVDVPRLERVFDLFCKLHNLPWWYAAPEPCGVAVTYVTHRLGDIPNVDVKSSTDCEACNTW